MTAPPRRRGAGRAAAALIALLLTPALLLAHQMLRESSPADGATLEAVPAEIRLTFSEPVRVEFSEVAVQGPEGPLAFGPLRRAEDNPRVLVAPVEGDWHAGSFTLRWVTVGSDGHRTDGTLSFVVADGAEGLPVEAPDPAEADAAGADAAGGDAPGGDTDVAATAPTHDPRVFPEAADFGPRSPGYTAVRLLLFAALILMLGAVAARWLVLPMTAQRRPADAAALRPGIDRGAATLGLVAAGLLLVATGARLWAQAASLFGVERALAADHVGLTLTLQPWATGWWIQAAAAVLAIVGFALARGGSRPGWAAAGLATLAAAVTPALSGHAASLDRLTWMAVPVDTAHVIAAGGWIGSLFALVTVGLPTALRLDDGRRGPAAAALVHGFSPTALAFTGVLVVTGVISAWLHLGAVPALWTSPYGRTLLLKVAIFSGVALVGAYNFFRVRPALGQPEGAARLRRSGAVELALAAAVILVTAILVAVPPPGG